MLYCKVVIFLPQAFSGNSDFIAKTQRRRKDAKKKNINKEDKIAFGGMINLKYKL